MKKITDNEIIKAKEHFQYGISHDIFKEPVLSYAKTVLWAFEEINRQKAEVKRLNKEANKQQLRRQMYRSTVDEIKAEAIKEFAEKFKNLTASYWLDNINKGHIDTLVKEMVGDIPKIEHNSLCETETYEVDEE